LPKAFVEEKFGFDDLTLATIKTRNVNWMLGAHHWPGP
jgi:hypothetical protein